MAVEKVMVEGQNATARLPSCLSQSLTTELRAVGKRERASARPWPLDADAAYT